MLQKFIRRFLLRRHYWRHVGFDELSELYVSAMFRSLAVSLVGIFVPLYLLQNGFHIHTILMFYAVFSTSRLFADLLAGYAVAQWGPKHAIIFSQCLQILTSGLLVLLPEQRGLLLVIAVIWGLASSFFFIAFHVDFSKVKHAGHGGKEVGWLNVMERAGQAVGPLAGGLIATLFGAQYTFAAAVGLLLIGLFPLLMSEEPVKTHQKLDLKGLSPIQLKRDVFAHTALTLENAISVILWPIFSGAFILTGYVYAEMGMLSSASMVFAIIAAVAIGKVVDNHQGRRLLRFSATANGLLHMFRPFTSTLSAALGVNIINEVVTTGYRLPFQKGVYDTADSWPGHRIVYIVTLEFFGEIAKSLAFWGLFLLSIFADGKITLTVGFVIGALASCAIMTERFRALEPWHLFYKLDRHRK